MILKRLVIVLIFSLFFQQQFSSSTIADTCKDFYDEVTKKEQINFPYLKRNDLGIFFNYEWDQDIKKRIIKRSKKNKYPIVKISFTKQLSPGTAVKSINGKDLSAMNDMDLWSLIENTQSAEIEFLSDEKINKIEINAKKYNELTFYLDFFTLNSINAIEAIDGYFSIDYKAIFAHERTDIKEKGKILGTDACIANKLVKEKELYEPRVNIVSFEKDEDKTDIESFFYYREKTTWMETTFSGLAKIRSRFNFYKFPFDNQVLKIKINTGDDLFTDIIDHQDLQIISIQPTAQVFKSLINYQNSNYLQEWKVTNTEVSSEFVRHRLSDVVKGLPLSDTITLTINLKRNSNYYLYKIIIPVFLILIIAWSVLWIPAKEIEARLTTSIVALLSLIAYNFVFQDEIPKLDILTSLDKFILLSYLFCAIPIFMTIFLSRFVTTNQKRAYFINRRMRLWGGIIYIVTNLQIFFLN